MTNEALEAIVVEFGGKSYIRPLGRKYGYSTAPYDKIIVNGVAGLDFAQGDNKFLVFDGAPVESVQLARDPRHLTTKHELRDDLRGIDKPSPISVDQYRALEDKDQALYSAVQETVDQEPEQLTFAIQEEDGAPSTLPWGVTSVDPHNFARFSAFHHLGMVRASSRYMLYRLAQRIQDIAEDSPYIKLDRDYSAEAIRESEWKDAIYITLKPMSINGINVTATNVVTTFSIDWKRAAKEGVRQIGYVDGDNLEDLENKISEFVERWSEKIASWSKPNHCPCCQRRFAKHKNPIK